MVFCSQCGQQAPDVARFCASCGYQLASSAPSPPVASPPLLQSPPPPPSAPLQHVAGTGSYSYSTSPPSYSPISPISYAAPTPPLAAQTSPTVLIDSMGRRTQAFEALSDALFSALDSNIEPRSTGGLEGSKLVFWRQVGGLSIPPYFESKVLPYYYTCILASTYPNLHVEKPVLTLLGWKTFLHHKIVFDPSNTFPHLQAAINALRLQLPTPLRRDDLPAVPDPNAQEVERRFQTNIRAGAVAFQEQKRKQTRHNVVGAGKVLFNIGSSLAGGGSGGSGFGGF